MDQVVDHPLFTGVDIDRGDHAGNDRQIAIIAQCAVTGFHHNTEIVSSPVIGIGICRIPLNAWRAGATPRAHTHAIVLLLEHQRVPHDEPRARSWAEGNVQELAEMRATEIAGNLAGHIRLMGFDARADVPGQRFLDEERLAVLAGLAVRRDDESLANPYVDAFSLIVISTDYDLICDSPLAAAALNTKGFRYWWGINDAQSGRERNRRAKRASWASRYPMETVKRVARPTTLILDDEVNPAADTSAYSDPAANAKAIKALSYFLGSDLTGICEVPRYAWYSHKDDGTPIEMYHRYAVVMLIDQGFETMEGASGDDWISGSQSMRGYQRGAEIAGIMSHHLGQLGFSARAQTNADSDVLQIPLVLLAGLGELSRIGELVLNPFVRDA